MRPSRSCRLTVCLPAAILIILFVFAGACALEELPDSDGGEPGRPVEPLPGVDVLEPEVSSPRDVRLDEIPARTLEPAWSLSFANRNSLAYSLSGDGSLAVVAYRRAHGEYVARGLDPAAEERWNYVTPERNFVSADVRVLNRDGSDVGLALYTTEGAGELRILDESGAERFSRRLAGLTGFCRSPDGEVIALLDRSASELVLVDAAIGTRLGSREVGEHATVNFIPETKWLLLQTDEKIAITDRETDPLWSQRLDVDLRGDVAVAEGGRKIALTTVDPDSVLYVFDRSADLVWKHLLFPGGNNDLCLREDNAQLLVYNVGAEGGILLMDMESGETEWRYFLRSSSKDASARIDAAVFDSGGGVILHAVTSRRQDSQVEEKHRLVFISPEGEIEGQKVLGVNVGVDLAEDGSSAVVASGEADPETGARVLDTLTYYEFDVSTPLTSILSRQ